MRAWSLSLWVLASGCRAAEVPAAAPPLAPVSLTARVESVVPLPPAHAEATPTPVHPPLVDATAGTPARTKTLVLLEPVYSVLGHPRLATEMQTLGRDEELFQWALGGSSDAAHPSNRPGYHPATRVVVDVTLLSRAPLGSTKRLLRLARSKGYWPLRACFEDAQRRAPLTERAARVRLTLSGSGKVLGARSMGPAPEREYAACVLGKLRALDFTPGFTRKLDVEISVQQWPGHAPVPPRAPAEAERLRLPSEANAALAGFAPAIGECYEAALEDDPKLWGRLVLRLKLGADGAIEDATPTETQFPNDQVIACARRAIIGARLPAASVSELSFAVRLGQSAAPPLPPAPGTLGTPPSPPLETGGSPPAPEPPAPAPPPPSH